MIRSSNRFSPPRVRTGARATSGRTRGRLFRQLAELRTELAELAFQLDIRGRSEAAEIVAAVGFRVAELGAQSGAARAEGGAS